MASTDRGTKRQGYGQDPGEDTVDDLAVAAEYAQAAPPVVSAEVPCNGVDPDENEIELKSEDSEKGDDIKNEQSNIEDQSEDDDSSSDEESDVDLAEELARMQDEDADGTTTDCPKTVNEVDPYHTAVEQLESTFSMSLAVEEQDRLKLSTSSSVRLSLAGRIQHHMVEERTIVVRSQPDLLLEEGNLLLLKTGKELVPLGRIFEVFGPVSQPLYSIRLPQPPSSKVETEEKKEDRTREDKKAEARVSKIPDAVKHANEDSKIEDAWAEHGRFSNLLKTSPALQVHYVKDDAKLIDTTVVYQVSGRGCDASNVHDEEVLNPNEMYYSDDEQERQAKGVGRKNKSGRGRGTRRNRPGLQSYERKPYLAPQGFYAVGQSVSYNSHPAMHQGYQGGHPSGYANQSPSAAYSATTYTQQQQQSQQQEESDTVYYEY